MRFKDLKALFAKDKRVSFFFLLLLLVGFSFFQFQTTFSWGLDIFGFLVYTCMIYLLFRLIFRKKTQTYAYYLLPLSLLLSRVLQLFMAINTFANALYVLTLFVFAIFFWTYITAIFTMNNAYDKTLKWDSKINKWSKSGSFAIRLIIFLGGAALATYLIFAASDFLLNYIPHTPTLDLMIIPLRFLMMIPIWGLFITGLVSLFFEKKYLWLGTYFIVVALFTIYQMIKAAQAEYSLLYDSQLIPLQIIQFVFSLYLLLGTSAALVGEQSVLIAKRLKIIRPDTILLLLILSMAIWTRAEALDPYWSALLVYLSMIDFFPLLVGVFGIYAIIHYHKKYGKEKEVENEMEQTKIIENSMEDRDEKTINSEGKQNWTLFSILFSVLWIIYLLLCVFYFSFLGGAFYGSFLLILTYFSWERFSTYRKDSSYLVPLAILIALAAILYYVIEIIVFPLLI